MRHNHEQVRARRIDQLNPGKATSHCTDYATAGNEHRFGQILMLRPIVFEDYRRLQLGGERFNRLSPLALQQLGEEPVVPLEVR